VIGEGKCAHAQTASALRKVGDRGNAVFHRIMAMNVKVYEIHESLLPD
jgi:predicted nuclease with RNAse H fold